jgi:phage FluMu protein gp41
MIKLNAFVTINSCFNSFRVFRIPLAGDPRSRFQLARVLFDNEVAYAYPYREYLYFKGIPNKTLDIIKNIVQQDTIQGRLILGSVSEPESLYLTHKDEVIIKPIFYSAFEKILESRGFQVLWRNVKKAVPKVSGKDSTKELIELLTNDIVVLRGLKYMLEIRPSGSGILWLDIYSPPFSLKNMSKLSIREIKRLKLMEMYRNKAILKSRDRLAMLHKIINILCDSARILVLKFPDGDLIEFSMELLQL